MLLAAACDQPARDLGADLPSTPRGPDAVAVLRLPRAGGPPRLYRIPSLDTVGWRMLDPLPPIQRVVGADPEQGVAFVIDRAGNLVALDLDTRRIRPQLRRVRTAVLGPDGAVYAVDSGRVITRLVRRTPVRFRARLRGEPRDLYAVQTGALLVRMGGQQPVLEVLTSDRQPASIDLPNGAVVATRLGDLVAVATDTAVVLYSADPSRKPVSIRVSGARAAAFSPSGHLLYVVGSENEMVVVDRFGQDVLESIDLPGPARDVRADAYGRWLLVQPATGDSVWMIDLGTRRHVGAVRAQWTRNFPIVAPPNTLLIAQRGDVVARDLAAPGFPETGRVTNGANDFWLPIAWHPKGDAPAVPDPLAVTDTAAEPDDVLDDSLPPDFEPAPKVYLQLSSSRNPAWAEELAAKLRAAGLLASVLPPKQSDEAYLVVLGPYATREQAEEASRGLGMPSFVITVQDE